MIRGDARLLPGLLPPGTAGQAALVASPRPRTARPFTARSRPSSGAAPKAASASTTTATATTRPASPTRAWTGCSPGSPRSWPAARCCCALAGWRWSPRGGKLIARPSFLQLGNLRRARAKGQPWHLIVHEDVLIFRSARGAGLVRRQRSACRRRPGRHLARHPEPWRHHRPGLGGGTAYRPDHRRLAVPAHLLCRPPYRYHERHTQWTVALHRRRPWPPSTAFVSPHKDISDLRR